MSLKNRLIEMIQANGPLPVSVYMQLCLHDPEHGYYATRPGLGTDFITAPEISQVFGELLGLWTAHEWQVMGRPDNFNLVEFGPGRGTLMADALRAVRKTPVETAIALHLIEPSASLRKIQAERLATASPIFVSELSEISIDHTIILANEYLDCLPARQFAVSNGDWYERVIGMNDDDELAFGLSADRAPETPPRVSDTAELQPGLELVVDQLRRRKDAGDRFRALFIDYGTVEGPPGDTLRAYQNGEQIHPLAQPGASDLTVDVDFARLAQLAEKAGMGVSGPITQGEFLGRLGIEARMQALIKSNPDQANQMFSGVQKLVDPAEMGERFKVICISSPGLPEPAGFSIKHP